MNNALLEIGVTHSGEKLIMAHIREGKGTVCFSASPGSLSLCVFRYRVAYAHAILSGAHIHTAGETVKQTRQSHEQTEMRHFAPIYGF